MDNDFATGYALGADSNCSRNDGGMWGDGGWWAIILLFALFGWGNGGWGGFGGNGGGQGALTRSDLCSEFNFNNLDSAVRGIQNGLCDGFYAMNTSMLNSFNSANTAMLQNFNGVQSQLSNMAAQNQACCCETQRLVERGFADTNYNMATNTCAIQNTIQSTTRDIIDNQNANYRGIIDFLTQDKISTLQAENQSLKLAASQSNQNAYLTAAMDANTAELIRRINPAPVPAYNVPAPYPFCGSGYGGNYGCSGCGC